jgi:hypothetical protein
MPPRIHDMVERQILQWESQQRTRTDGRNAIDPPSPIISISRQVWALGTQLGSLVAEHMHYEFWDQEVVHRIANETGASEAFLHALDERARGVIEDVVAGALAGDAFTRNEYMSHLLRVLHAIGRGGRAVIIGRGAQYVLPSATVLRVRVVAPLEQRARNLAQAHGLSERDARTEIERVERDRRAFIQQQFKRDVADPCHYDLTVNTGVLSLEQAAAIVECAYNAKFAPPESQERPG